MSKYLIIGGMGLIGLNIANLLDDEDEVYLVDNMSSSRQMSAQKKQIYDKHVNMILKKSNIHFLKEDVKNVDSMRKIIEDIIPDKIIYLAALLASESEKNPLEAEEVIFKGIQNTVQILESLRKSYRLVYASSSYVYGDFKFIPATEDHPLEPLDTYGHWKKEGESFIRGYNFNFGEWIIIRPSSVYGIVDPRERYASTCVEQAYFKQKVQLHYPDFICDFTYVKDVAKAFILAVNSTRVSEIYNATFGDAKTNKEFIDELSLAIPDFEVQQYDDFVESAPKRGALDCTKAQKQLDWHPEFNVKAGIADSINQLKKLDNVDEKGM